MKVILIILMFLASIPASAQEAKYKYNVNSGILTVDIGGVNSRLYAVKVYAYNEACGAQCVECDDCAGAQVRDIFLLESQVDIRMNMPAGKYIVRAYYTASNYPEILKRCDNMYFVEVTNPSKYLSLVKAYK